MITVMRNEMDFLFTLTDRSRSSDFCCVEHAFCFTLQDRSGLMDRMYPAS